MNKKQIFFNNFKNLFKNPKVLTSTIITLLILGICSNELISNLYNKKDERKIKKELKKYKKSQPNYQDSIEYFYNIYENKININYQSFLNKDNEILNFYKITANYKKNDYNIFLKELWNNLSPIQKKEIQDSLYSIDKSKINKTAQHIMLEEYYNLFTKGKIKKNHIISNYEKASDESIGNYLYYNEDAIFMNITYQLSRNEITNITKEINDKNIHFLYEKIKKYLQLKIPQGVNNKITLLYYKELGKLQQLENKGYLYPSITYKDPLNDFDGLNYKYNILNKESDSLINLNSKLYEEKNEKLSELRKKIKQQELDYNKFKDSLYKSKNIKTK